MHQFYTYLIESGISISIFYLFYEIFLKRDTWFRFNRYFLLSGIIISVIIPLLDFSTQDIIQTQNQFIFDEYIAVNSTISSYKEQTVEVISKPNYTLILYLLTGLLFLARFIYQLVKIFKTIHANEKINYRDKKIVLLNNDCSPFSFFNYIFINKDDYSSIGSNELLMHEFTHAHQKHSIDIILLELLLVLQWFNPFIYRYRLAFKEIHEYLADQGVLQSNNNDKVGYQKLILDQIEKSFSVNLASQFNYSLTKNRIKMMTRINSGKLSTLKILFIIPMLTILLMAFSTKTGNNGIIMDNIGNNSVLKQSNDDRPSIFPVQKVEGVKISARFGMMIDPITKKEKNHKAVDIKAPVGTPVYATADGLVRKIELNHVEGKGYGKYLILDHKEGFSTLYSMLSEYNVKEGQEVQKGDIIGYVGSTGRSTGPHLHYEIKKDGENVDPEKYF